jgi:hypothetical protein
MLSLLSITKISTKLGELFEEKKTCGHGTQYTKMLIVFPEFFPEFFSAQKTLGRVPKVSLFVTFFGAYNPYYNHTFTHQVHGGGFCNFSN